MIQRLNKLLESLRKKKTIKEDVVSTTVDDTIQGKRKTFDAQKVADALAKHNLLEGPVATSKSTELLRKCGLLEKPEQTSDEKPQDSKDTP